jgi:hypothetical protein
LTPSGAAVCDDQDVRWPFVIAGGASLEDGTGTNGGRGTKRLPLEVLVVWTLFAVVAAELAVTYSRFDPGELYDVSRSGFAGGMSRLLVFLNFPVALVAIGVLLLLLESLGRLKPLGIAGIVLAAAVFWPGVVDPGDLDARPVNAIAACGVAVGVAATLVVWRTAGRERRLDRTAVALRLALGAVALVIAVPWIAAESGVSFAGVPALGTLYQTTELRSEPGSATLEPAVHHGHHHGMDGTLLVWTALLLLPLAARVGSGGLRFLTRAYLSLMLCYGAALIANDAWLEQVVKRGWTSWQIPNALQPSVSPVWGVVVVATAILLAVLTLPHRSPRIGPRRPADRAAVS